MHTHSQLDFLKRIRVKALKIISFGLREAEWTMIAAGMRATADVIDCGRGFVRDSEFENRCHYIYSLPISLSAAT